MHLNRQDHLTGLCINRYFFLENIQKLLIMAFAEGGHWGYEIKGKPFFKLHTL